MLWAMAKPRKKPKTGVAQLRWCIPAQDMQSLLSIEQENYGNAGWNYADFQSVLRCPVASIMVAEYEGEVVGYSAYQLPEDESVVDLLSLVVRKKMRRCGIGSQLIASLKLRLDHSKLSPEDIRVIVSDRNLAAQLFLRSQGFHATQIVPGMWKGEGDRTVDGYEFHFPPG